MDRMRDRASRWPCHHLAEGAKAPRANQRGSKGGGSLNSRSRPSGVVRARWREEGVTAQTCRVRLRRRLLPQPIVGRSHELGVVLMTALEFEKIIVAAALLCRELAADCGTRGVNGAAARLLIQEAARSAEMR